MIEPVILDGRPKITALAPWFGGKRTLAPAIVQELGQHRFFLDPCCGGLSVLFAKERSSHEIVNDMHGDLTNLARVVQSDDAPRLYDRLSRTLMAEALVDEAQAILKEPYQGPADPERAFWYFVGSWAGRNGMSGLARVKWQIVVRWSASGGSGSVRFRSAVDSLPWWHQRLRGVEILSRDMFSILPRIEDDKAAAIYVDPPYMQGGARSGSSKYLYEFGTSDHESLAAELLRFQKARVVVSYYADPRLDSLYPPDRWTRRLVKATKVLHIANGRRNKPVDAPEVLLLNGPSYRTGPLMKAAELFRGNDGN